MSYTGAPLGAIVLYHVDTGVDDSTYDVPAIIVATPDSYSATALANEYGNTTGDGFGADEAGGYVGDAFAGAPTGQNADLLVFNLGQNQPVQVESNVALGTNPGEYSLTTSFQLNAVKISGAAVSGNHIVATSASAADWGS